MKRSTWKKIILFAVFIGVIAGGYILYLYFMPHRDVQNTDAFASLTAEQIVKEYLKDASASNAKYLSDDGNSKVLIITGIISSISTDQNSQTVILLKNAENEAGVSCTLQKESSHNSVDFNIGDHIKIKGAIRSGASYDEDLEMYEDVILEECDVIE